jgi:glycogen synthase
MTRLLMTADAAGGVWTYSVELARALSIHGFTTTIATMGPPPAPDQIAEASRVKGVGLVHGDFRLEWMEGAVDDVEASGEWLMAIAERVWPMIVHLNGYVHGALDWDAPVVIAAHSCLASWSAAVGIELAPELMNWYRPAVRRGLRAADWIVAPTSAMLASVRQQYGPFRSASVVSNGRTASRFGDRCEKEPIVFTAGRLWDPAKNIDALLAVEDRLSWPVFMAGYAEARKTTADSDRRAAAGGYLGRLSEAELARWLARASIFVLPARYEPFGLGPLEAALAGCALVLGDIPTLREVWGDAAVYVNPEDGGALADAIERLIANPAARTARANRCRARALTYSVERMAAAYVSVYAAAAAGKAAGSRGSLCGS